MLKNIGAEFVILGHSELRKLGENNDDINIKVKLALKNKLNIPGAIIDETYRVLYEEKPPLEALKDLLKVEVTTEFFGVKGLQ